MDTTDYYRHCRLRFVKGSEGRGSNLAIIFSFLFMFSLIIFYVFLLCLLSSYFLEKIIIIKIYLKIYDGKPWQRRRSNKMIRHTKQRE